MPILRLPDEAKRLEARKRALRLDDARLAAARNKGAARTVSKQQLLEAIEDETSAGSKGAICRQLLRAGIG